MDGKRAFKTSLGPKIVSYIDLKAVLYLWEARINLLPLTYLEDKMTLLKPLTRTNFMQGI